MMKQHPVWEGATYENTMVNPGRHALIAAGESILTWRDLARPGGLRRMLDEVACYHPSSVGALELLEVMQITNPQEEAEAVDLLAIVYEEQARSAQLSADHRRERGEITLAAADSRFAESSWLQARALRDGSLTLATAIERHITRKAEDQEDQSENNYRIKLGQLALLGVPTEEGFDRWEA